MARRRRRLLALAIRLLPRSRRELGAALLAELSAVPLRRQRAAWLIGGMWFVVKENLLRTLGFPLGLLAAVAALVAVDRLGTSDDSGQVSMLVLLLAALALGFFAPQRAWLAALVLGSALAVAQMLYATVGPAPVHAPEPGGIGGAATLFVLVVPALVAAYLGAGAAWLTRRGH